MNWFPPDFGYITLEETDSGVLATINDANKYDFMIFLEENDFNYEEVSSYEIIINDPLDEIYEELIEYNVSVYLTEETDDLVISYFPQSTILISEGAAKRKIVIRKGRRKIVFQCPPGQKKISRRCIRRPAKEIQKLRRRAKRAARKAKSKRSSAIRKRKISLKRRKSFDHTKSHKSHKK